MHRRNLAPPAGALLVLFILQVCAVLVAAAQVPQTIGYQGYLTDADGNPIDDPAVTLTFRLMPDSGELTNGQAPVWMETQTGVTVADGVFSVLLGSVESLAGVEFDDPLWLSVAIGDETAEELKPRTPLASVPFSFQAASVADDGVTSAGIVDGGVTSSDIADGTVTTSDLADGAVTTSDIADDAVTESKIADDAVTGSKIADGAAVRSLNGLTDDVTLEAGENVTLSTDGNVLTIAADAGSDSGSFDLPLDLTVESSDADAFSITNIGTRAAATFRISNPTNFNSALLVSTNGTGPALFARTFGQGSGALFRIDGNFNTSPAVEAVSASSEAASVALVANHSGNHPDADIARFQNDGTNVARVNKDGVGFFNGGTQNSGADVAEAFDVEGAKSRYEPGDVLVISTQSDRRVTRTSEPYSKLVLGVYAEKPGVLLTERGIGEDISDLVPMGVVGVIRTKVSAENGPIRRGDLLVTSSIDGHAMRGTDPERMLGAVIGKALQNFEGPGTGMIQVMVNVR